MPKRTTVAQMADDGKIPPLFGDTDVEQLVWLLEVCRQRGYRIGPTVQVGTVIAQVTDVRLTSMEGLGTPTIPTTDVWDEHGRDASLPIVDGTAGR